MSIDFSFYFAVFMRRLHIFIIVFTLVLASALAAAFLLPRSYQTEARLLVESSQIPGQLAPPSVQLAALEQLQVIQNRLMTRQNLLDIARRLHVFKDIDKMNPDEIVEAMRRHTFIDNQAGQNMATLMIISFVGESGQTVANVVNEYVTMILQENVAIRTQRAEQTLQFFDQEVKQLGVELDKKNAEILEFQNKNADALPNSLAFRLTQQAALQDRLSTADRDIAQLNEQKTRLVAIFKSTGQVNDPVGIPQTPEAQQLATLRDQLNAALAVYSKENPKVKIIQAQIAQLEPIVLAQGPITSGQQLANSPSSMLDVQLADIDTRVALAKEQRDQIAKQLATLTNSIDRTPANQINLDAMMRDLANIQQQYDLAVSRQASAATGEKIEVLSKGERIVVLDAATVPDRPSSPNRVMIAAGGVVAGAGLGLGLIALLEFLNKSVRRPKDLVRAFDVTPIATIPYIRTPSETVIRRTGFLALLVLAVVGIPALFYAVHVYVVPLDVILNKIAARFGIRM